MIKKSVGEYPIGSTETWAGMTYREHLIAQALAGYTANPGAEEDLSPENLAAAAIEHADAIIDLLDAEREGEQRTTLEQRDVCR